MYINIYFRALVSQKLESHSTDFDEFFVLMGSPLWFLGVVESGRWRCCRHPENTWTK